MRQWRCEACDKLLGEFSFVVGAIKCPRCRLVNTQRVVRCRFYGTRSVGSTTYYGAVLEVEVWTD